MRALIFVLFLIPNFVYAAANLCGQVTLCEKGGEPLANVQISVIGAKANPVITLSDGQFELVVEDKNVGEDIRLVFAKPGYAVVNRVELKKTLPAEPSEQLLQIVMCETEQRDECAVRFYNIYLENVVSQTYQELLDRLDKKSKTYWDSLATLIEERDKALAMIKELKLTQRFADIQLDEVSNIYLEALTYFQNNEIEKALDLLALDKLDKQQESLRQRKQQAYEELESVAREQQQLLKSYMLGADISITQFRFDDAIVYYKKALAADTTNFDNHWTVADFLTDQNQFLQAKPLLERALTLAPNLTDSSAILNNLGILYKNLNDYTAAQTAYERALSIREKLAETNPAEYLPDVAQTLSNLGIFHRSLNDYSAARNVYERALSICEKLAETNPATHLLYVANILNNLGVLYSYLNDYAAAQTAYERALSIYEKLAETNSTRYLPEVAMTFNNLGILHRHFDDYAAVQNSLERALSIYEKLAETNPGRYLPDVAMTLNNLGGLHWKLHNYVAALTSCERALFIRKKLAESDPDTYLPGIASILNSLGLIHCGLNDYTAAYTAYEESLLIYEKLAEINPDQYVLDLARVRLDLSFLYKAQLEAGLKGSYQEKGLKSVNQVLDELEYYGENVPMARELRYGAVYLKVYFMDIKN